MIFISINIYVFCGKSERESWAKLPEPEMRSEGTLRKSNDQFTFIIDLIGDCL